MIESFHQLIKRLKALPRQRICVAGADDEQVLLTIRDVIDEDIASVLLVGQQDYIWKTSYKIGLNLNKVDIINEPDPNRAAMLATNMLDSPDVGVLMKGALKSKSFLRELAAWPAEGGGALSYLAAYNVPDHDRLIYVTDGGICISPTLEEKIAILCNAVNFLHSVGLMMPKVAVLSANEKVSPKMPVTVEAQQIADLFRQGKLTGALVEGPMALDVAISKDAARQKGMNGPVAANADLILVPNLEVGNIIDKAIIHFARGKKAAVVLGAKKPVALATGKEKPFHRLCSLALACYAVAEKQNGTAGE